MLSVDHFLIIHLDPLKKTPPKIDPVGLSEYIKKLNRAQSKSIFLNSQITSKINKFFWLFVFGIPTGMMGFLFFMLRS